MLGAAGRPCEVRKVISSGSPLASKCRSLSRRLKELLSADLFRPLVHTQILWLYWWFLPSSSASFLVTFSSAVTGLLALITQVVFPLRIRLFSFCFTFQSFRTFLLYFCKFFSPIFFNIAFSFSFPMPQMRICASFCNNFRTSSFSFPLRCVKRAAASHLNCICCLFLSYFAVCSLFSNALSR